MLCILPTMCFANENWQDHWHCGQALYEEKQYSLAAIEFNRAIDMMSEEEQEIHPAVLVDRAENNYYLQNYSQVFLDTEKALKSKYLTEYEKFTCGSRRSATFYFTGAEDKAMEEYEKYVSNSPIFPKFDRVSKKLVIRAQDYHLYKDVSDLVMIADEGSNSGASRKDSSPAKYNSDDINSLLDILWEMASRIPASQRG